MEFFKASGLNLYLIDGKQPAQRVGGKLIPLAGYYDITDYSKYAKQIKTGDNLGFRTGLQYASNKNIIVLDFDIYDPKTGGINEETQNLYNNFAELDTTDKIGFFTGSTCHNMGVLLDITNDEDLKAIITQARTINNNKIAINGLEIMYNNNVVLPPSATNCKKCKRTHKPRAMLNAEMGFCVPNGNQTHLIMDLITEFINEKQGKTTTTTTTPNKVAKVAKVAKSALIDVSRIHKNKMLVILECLAESRFTATHNEGWGQLLVQVANANNSEEVIKAFWQRCRVGAYSNITYNEIANAVASVKISENFNNANLWKMAKQDNEQLYNKYFNRYDEPTFEYEKMTFTDDAGNPSHFINYKQVKAYFGDSKYCFIKSSLGTGKTQFIKNVVEKEYSGETTSYNYKGKLEKRPTRIAFITMRQSLARSLMEDFRKLRFTNYLEEKGGIYKFDKIIISLDSLEKIGSFDEETGVYTGTTYDLIICDEICSLLKHFDFKEIKNVNMCYQIFKTIIRCSKQTYFLDGDLSNREIGWFNTYIKQTKDEVPKPLFNGLMGIKYDLKLSYCKAGQYNKILEALEAGKNLAIVCMSSAECLKMYDALSDKYRCKVIYGNSSDAEKAELCNINSIITNYQCFIYSPSISVGVDINPKIEGVIYKHFDCIFGYVCENSVCPRDYFQMLARVRNPKSLEINILIANFEMQKTGLYDIIPFEKYYRIMFGDEPANGLSYIKCWNKWETDNSRYWLDVFEWYAIQKGHSFEIVQTTKAEFATAAQKLNDTKSRLNIELIKSNRAELVFDATLLNIHPRAVSDYNIYKFEDAEIKNEIYKKRIITEEDIELLSAIDYRNNWDNLEHKQKAIENNEAMTHDKLNVEKTIYWQFFGLNANTTLEDFQEHYFRKIDIVKNNMALQNLNELIEVAPMTSRGQEFDGEILNKKIKYINDIMRILGADGYKKQIITKEIDCDALNAILQDKEFKITFGIMDKSRGSKKILKKNDRTEIIEKAFTRTQIITRVKEILSEFGFEYTYNRVRIDGDRVNAYELGMSKAVEQYKMKRAAAVVIAPAVEEVELDF